MSIGTDARLQSCVRAHSEDPELFENSYAEWLRMAEANFELVQRKFPGAMKVYVTAAELGAWCVAHGEPNSSDARARFTSEKIGIIHGE